MLHMSSPAPSHPEEPSPAEAPPPPGRHAQLRLALRWSLAAATLMGIAALLWAAHTVLLPFAIGLALAYLLTPFVNLAARRMPRPLAILLVYAVGIALVITSFLYLVPLLANQLIRIINALPTIAELRATANTLLEQYRTVVPAEFKAPIEQALFQGLEALQANLATYAQRLGAFLVGSLMRLLDSITFLLGFLTLPIWLFYILNDQGRLPAALDRLIHPAARADFWNVWRIIDLAFSSYVRGQLILCLSVGLAVGLGLVLIEAGGAPIGDYVLLLSIIAGVTEFVPVLGPTIGAIPGVLIGLSISPLTGLAMLALYVVVQQLENSLLVPRIIGDSINIHPAVLTVVIIIAGTLFGIVGIILAAPVIAIARDLVLYSYRRLEGVAPPGAFAALGHTRG